MKPMDLLEKVSIAIIEYDMNASIVKMVSQDVDQIVDQIEK